MRGDEVVGEVLHLEEPRPLGEHAHVAGTVAELVFQGQVAEQSFVDRLHLVNGRLDQGERAPQRRADDVGHGVEQAQLRGDAGGTAVGVARVLPQLAANGVGAGLLLRARGRSGPRCG